MNSLSKRRSTQKSGFTLLELLVAVAIFSGLMIVILGSFSRSAFSLAGVDSLRQKSQAARGLIDAITNDWQFLHLQDSASFAPAQFKDDAAGVNNKLYRGYSFSRQGDRLLMLLKYPNSSADQLVRRVYKLETISNRPTLSVAEDRECKIGANSLIECLGPPGVAGDLLSANLSTDTVSNPLFRSQFSGELINDAVARMQTGYLNIRLTVKPTDLATASPRDVPCQDAPPGSCYTVSTTLIAGALR